MNKILITEKDAGKRLDKFLPDALEGISRSRIVKLIEEEAITINGKPAVKKALLAAGDCVDISDKGELTRTPESTPLPQNIPLEILFEDEWLLAVNKPSGLVVHPGHGTPDGTLVNALLYRNAPLSEGFTKERPGIVHRLDKDTSGVLLVAKTQTVHTQLAQAFALRTVQKQYLAFCIGQPSSQEGTIDLPLERNRREPIKRAVSPQGKASVTAYRVLAEKNGIALMLFAPKTGRTHQIRVHCSASGFPVMTDLLYGGGKDRILRISPAERPGAYQIYKCFSRHALHAYSVVFEHPVTHQEMSVTAPLPYDFTDALRCFGILNIDTLLTLDGKY